MDSIFGLTLSILKLLINWGKGMNVEHSISGDDDSKVTISEDLDGDHIIFEGSHASLTIYVDMDHLQSLFNQLVDIGFKKED